MKDSIVKPSESKRIKICYAYILRNLWIKGLHTSTESRATAPTASTVFNNITARFSPTQLSLSQLECSIMATSRCIKYAFLKSDLTQTCLFSIGDKKAHFQYFTRELSIVQQRLTNTDSIIMVKFETFQIFKVFPQNCQNRTLWAVL